MLAWLIQTDLGRVSVQDIRFQSESGATLSALLYTPDTASRATPAPGVLAIHGYINTRETQSPYAIELSRRGYVVLSLDQRGHGYSDPPAFAEGFGGPAGLQFLRGLETVDKDQIVLVGHSMGGWSVLSAASTFPDQYSSVIVSGSSTGTFGVPAGDAEFPRNFGLVYGKYDEFSASMWQSFTGAGVVETDKLKAQFNTDQAVEIGRLYGSVADGTARRLYQPSQTHPANHITQSGIAPVLDWVQMTSNAPNSINPEQQRWPLKELGTLVSLIGGILFLFSFARFLLAQAWFEEVSVEPVPAIGIQGKTWWLSVSIFVAVPALTYFQFQGYASQIPTNSFFGQNLTTGIMIWALGNGLISVLLLILWFYLLGGKAAGNNLATLGLALPSVNKTKRLALTALFSLIVVGGLYLVLVVNHALFTADFRFWVVALKLMNSIHLREFLVYLIPFTLFFIISGSVLNGQLRNHDESSTVSALVKAAVLAGLGIALLLAVQYTPLFAGSTLAIAPQALLTIVAIQFLFLLPLTGVISSYFFRQTGAVYAGAFINGLFITWQIVAGQATHYAF